MFIWYHCSPQASNYTSPWHWTKVTATGEWHSADTRKESTQNMQSTEMPAFLPNSNDFHNFQQLVATNPSGNSNAAKNRMANMNLVNGSSNNASNTAKAFQMPYPFLPPPNQTLSAQNPLSPTNSTILPSAMTNPSAMSTQSSTMQNVRAFSMDRVTGSTLESNTNQISNQSNSTDQSATQQHNSMISPTRHLPFPYSNLNNYHRNF